MKSKHIFLYPVLALMSFLSVTSLRAQTLSEQSCKDLVRKADSIIIRNDYWEAHPYYLEAAHCKSQRDYALLQMKSYSELMAHGISDRSKVRAAIIAGDYSSIEGDTAKANAHYREALQIWPDDSMALSRIRRNGANAPMPANSNNKEYSIAILEAKDALTRKDYAGAVKAYENALAAKPGDEAATRMLADSRQMQAATQYHPSSNITYNETTDDTTLQVSIPNVFSSNSGSAYWQMTYKGPVIENFETSIFNRWGTKMYESHDPAAKWYGLSEKGSLLPDGTYFYIITLTPKGMSAKTYNGFVTFVH